MDYDKRVELAKSEAQRFIERANEYLELKEWGRTHASMLRASMDLSNALLDNMGVIKLIKFGNDYELLCPRCNGNYTHHEKIITFERSEDDHTCLETRIVGKKSTSQITMGLDNPSPRRHGMCIDVYCEACDNVSKLAIYQHKGQTFIEWIV